MKGEINRDFYCAIFFEQGYCPLWPSSWPVDKTPCDVCRHRRRKWPTPKQFVEEYTQLCEFKDGSWHLPDNIPAWYWTGSNWNIGLYAAVKNRGEDRSCVISCTPWGKPEPDWKPEKQT